MTGRDPPAGGLDRETVRAEWADWLDSNWQWDWFVTLTFDQDKVADYARAGYGKAPAGSPAQWTGHDRAGWAWSDESWTRYMDELADRNSVRRWTGVGWRGGRPPVVSEPHWVRFREANPAGNGTHFHALVGGVGALGRTDDAWAWWFHNYGHARILPYDPGRGVAAYVAKYVTKDLGEVKWSANIGDRMKKGLV